MRWRVSVQGTTTTLKAFLAVEKGIVDLRQLGAWKQVISTFHKITRRLFDSEGSSGKSGAWAPLSLPYVEQKQRRWGFTKILVASGALYTSLTSQAGDAVVQEYPQELVIGTSLLYAKFHQTGTDRMPARRPIDLTDEDEKSIVDPLKQKIRQLIQNARLRDTRGF